MSSIELNNLGPDAFQNLVNHLALKVLGLGNSSFGPGPDGGRDGYFEGQAPYPSASEQWNGVWYIQCKYHAPHLSANPQKWLVAQIADEIKLFDAPHTDRTWPDNWIIATNIDPSGKPETGSFDAIKNLLRKSSNGAKVHLAIWGGRKILDLLALNEDVARYYGHFITPGHVLTQLYEKLCDERASASEVVRYLVATEFREHLYTKLDQAGSSGDSRPGVHDLFIDLPFSERKSHSDRLLGTLCQAVAQCHRYSLRNAYPEQWREWLRHPMRARSILLKGGPGQGKSTVGQYLCQIHRAKLILAPDGPVVPDAVRQAAEDVKRAAERSGYWPTAPRIPIQVELKDYAQWFARKAEGHSRRVTVFVAEQIASKVAADVPAKLLKRVLAEKSWIVIFDGLDEVPHDSKESIANEVLDFLNDLVLEVDADVFAICTSRPQGYANQFAGIEGPILNLDLLNEERALACATPLLRYERSQEESDRSIALLASAMRSRSVTELMTTPLQSHIMAVVVRDGGRPPERRWQLFNTFYLVMKRREGQKNFQDPKIARLLREEDRLLKAVHMRLGFVLHARAETSEGAQTTLSMAEFKQIVQGIVLDLGEADVESMVASVMNATTERLVLVNTPESGDHVRFDIRQLQEFFAAEFIYDGVSPREIGKRVECIGGDAHWREVMHFLLSALVENRRSTELAVATQELRRLNEADERPHEIRYRRKTAVASLLLARLLVEGVVEQDQRDRQQLRPLAEPIAGTYDLESLVSLAGVTLPRTKQWLTDLLLDKTHTAAPTEYPAAMFLLGWLAPEDDLISPQLWQAFRQMPLAWQDRITAVWHASLREGRGRAGTDSIKLGRWVHALLAQMLNSDECYSHHPSFLAHAMAICSEDPKRFSECLRGAGVPKAIAESIPKVKPSATDFSDQKMDLGIVSGAAPRVNWQTGGKPACFANTAIRVPVAGTGGFVRLLLACVGFGEERTESTFEELKSELRKATKSRVPMLPESIAATIPISTPQALDPYRFDHILNTSFSDLKPALEAWRSDPSLAPIGHVAFVSPKASSPAHWEPCALYMPRVAGRLALGGDVYFPELAGHRPEVFKNDVVVKQLLEMPDLMNQFILGWGVLQQHNPTFLQALVDQVPAAQRAEEWYDTQNVKPFGIDLMTQGAVLVRLAPALVYWRVHFRPRAGTSDGARPSFASLLAGYGLDETTLSEILGSESYSTAVRAAALALRWLLAFEQAKGHRPAAALGEQRSLYTQYRNAENEIWLTEALVTGVLETYSASDPEAVSFASQLLEWYPDGDGPYPQIVRLIRTWRETSTAPVQAHQALERWLRYSFEEDLP